MADTSPWTGIFSNLSIFENGYIRNIREILQLWAIYEAHFEAGWCEDAFWVVPFENLQSLFNSE